MELIEVLLLGLALAMDAFAVSVSNGICYGNKKGMQILAAFLFGIFQAAMPMIGYFAGQAFSRYVEAFDHWIALILLGFLGGKMIQEAVSAMKHPEQPHPSGTFGIRKILAQAVATSIDALAAGVTIAVTFTHTSVWTAVFLIGIITVCCCLIGAFLGKKCGVLMKEKAAVFGGVILIGIGVKIFVEHMFF